MRVLLIGSTGQLGGELARLLRAPNPLPADNVELVSPTHAELELADPDAVRRAFDACRPELVVNAAAYNDVDGAESDRAGAFRVNCDAVALLGEEAARRRAGLITYSTDFVFDGKKPTSYVEEDETNPLSEYGASKLAGERALEQLKAPAVVLRTAWVYSLGRKSFVSTILRLAQQRRELRVVSDEVGSPSFAGDLARATLDLIARLGSDPFAVCQELRGVYHLAGSGSTSRYELARSALELDPKRAEHVVEKLVPIPSSELVRPARRPAHAPLDCSRIAERFGVRMPDWRSGLERALGGE